jgi:hypothetical protein
MVVPLQDELYTENFTAIILQFNLEHLMLSVRGREWIAVQWDECIAPWGVHYIGGRDPPRAGGQGGGG